MNKDKKFTGLFLFLLFLFLINACTEDIEGVQISPNKIYFPVSLVSDPDDDYLYVVNSNFDLLYKGGSVISIDIKTNTILSNATKEIGSFGGDITLFKNKEKEFLFVPLREDNSVVTIEVKKDKKNGKIDLICSEGQTPLEGGILRCDGKYVNYGKKESPIGRDPFASEVDINNDTGLNLLYIGSIRDGSISIFKIKEDGILEHLDNIVIGSGIHSIFKSFLTKKIYVTNRYYNSIFTLFSKKEEDKVKVKKEEVIIIPTVTKTGDYSRGGKISFDGTKAYVAYRSPSSLIIFDIKPDENGKPLNKIITSIEVGEGASGVATLYDEKAGKELVYVTCFYDDSVFVIDPSTIEVIDVIRVGNTPYDIEIINKKNEGILRAYITLFEEHAISVVELHKDSPFYHKELVRIR